MVYHIWFTVYMITINITSSGIEKSAPPPLPQQLKPLPTLTGPHPRVVLERMNENILGIEQPDDPEQPVLSAKQAAIQRAIEEYTPIMNWENMTEQEIEQNIATAREFF